MFYEVDGIMKAKKYYGQNFLKNEEIMINEEANDVNTLEEIEKENPSLKGILVKEYNSPNYRNVNLGELIDIFTNIVFIVSSLLELIFYH